MNHFSDISLVRASAPIAALALVHNPYFSNILLAVTDSLQSISLDLNLQSIHPEDHLSQLTTVSQSQADVAGNPAPEPYVSLTSTQPYRVPPLNAFARTLMNRDQGNRYQTPETLRLLGRHSELAQTKAHELVANLDQVKSRVELQESEFQRQVETLKELKQRVEEVTGHGQRLLSEPVKEVVVSQRLLLERMEKILRQQRANGSDQLTDAEKEWFRDLKRMEDEVIDMKNRAAVVCVVILPDRLDVARC